MTDRKSRYDSQFGASVSKTLAEAKLSQPVLAAKTGKSTAYVNQTITGRKKPSPEWIEIIADTLKLDDGKRGDLHRAAVRDLGYRIDLTKK